MKKYFALAVIIITVLSCSKKEEKLELFSPEAFAYSMDNGWELNASCRVKGFMQEEENDQFKAKLSFTANLQTPDGQVQEAVGEGLIDKDAKERIGDLPIETQIEIDSTYKAGKYYIIFNVTDDLTQKSATIKAEFELSK